MNLDPNALLVALLWGSVGLGVFVYGRKQGRLPHMLAGVALMAYPYFVSNWVVSAAIGGGITLVLWLAVRFGA
jgi:hypothetical protein